MNTKQNIEFIGHCGWQTCTSASNYYVAEPVKEYEFSNTYCNLENISHATICKNDYDICMSSTRQNKLNKIPRKFVRSRPLSEEELDRKRITANIQERRRMQRLNTALERLKRSIPQHLHIQSRRLSKIKTLKLAIDYIAFLNDSLQQDASEFKDTNQPTTMSSRDYVHSECNMDHEMTIFSNETANLDGNYNSVASNLVLPSVEDAVSFECDATNNLFELTADMATTCTKVVQSKDQSPYFLMSCQLE